MTIFCGVDLGKNGGLCMMDSHAIPLSIGEALPQILKLIPMPEDDKDIVQFLKDASTIIHKGEPYYQPCTLVMEEINVYTNARYNINATSQLLIQHGFFKGIAATLEIKVLTAHPKRWQHAMGCQVIQGKARQKVTAGMTLEEAKQYEKDYGSKGLALREAKKRFPGVRLIPDGRKVPHDGIVDALLLAEYGRILYNN